MARSRNKIDFILASASPRRRLLLKKAGYRFRIVPSHAKENNPKGLIFGSLVRHLALKKALSVAKTHPDQVVIGADTLVFVGRTPIGKPRNQKDAIRILNVLNNAWQRVYTGVAVVWKGGKKEAVGSRVSYVKFKKLTEDEIRDASKRHLDKAGAYSIQHKKDKFVERLKGDYDNVVGLPVKLVRKLLRRAAR